MRSRLGIDDIRPRTALLTGVLFAGIFAVVISPKPTRTLQVLSAAAGIGSFLLAGRNYLYEDSEQNQTVRTQGDGPQTVIQIGDVRAPINMEDVGRVGKTRGTDERRNEEED